MSATDRKKYRRLRLGSVEREILETLTTGDLLIGFLSSALSTRRMYKVARERAMARYRTQKSIDRLVDGGYITREGETVSLSKKGHTLLTQTTKALRDKIAAQKWDGKWRIITYDIPEKMRRIRNHIRAVVKNAGFVELQKSTWIYPHDCAELSELIKEDPRLKQYVLYGVLQSIENDSRLKRLFKIPE